MTFNYNQQIHDVGDLANLIVDMDDAINELTEERDELLKEVEKLREALEVENE